LQPLAARNSLSIPTKLTYSPRILNAQIATKLHALKIKTWFGFYLDDTIHNFRSTSGAAPLAVFGDIYEKHNILVTALANIYSAILKENSRSAFTDNRTSTEYRKERFAALLKACNLPSSDLSRRASSALQDRSRRGVNAKARRVRAVQAAESAGEEYGDCYGRPERRAEVDGGAIRAYVDVLVTSNEIGLAKDAGLFGEVLERCGIN
jgi:putative hydrolase of the HAD superfamily